MALIHQAGQVIFWRDGILSSVTNYGSQTVALRIDAEVMNNPEDQAGKKRVGHVEERLRGRVKLYHKLVLWKDITKPKVWTKCAKYRVSDHHEDNVNADNDEHTSALVDHLLLLSRLLAQGIVKALQEAAQHEANMDQPGVQANLHGQLGQIRDQKNVFGRLWDRLKTVLHFVINRHVLTRPLNEPEYDPDYQVDKHDNFQPLPFFRLLVYRLWDHHTPDDKRLEDYPDEDEKEDGLGYEADVWRGPLDLPTFVRTSVVIAQVANSQKKGANE